MTDNQQIHILYYNNKQQTTNNVTVQENWQQEKDLSRVPDMSRCMPLAFHSLPLNPSIRRAVGTAQFTSSHHILWSCRASSRVKKPLCGMMDKFRGVDGIWQDMLKPRVANLGSFLFSSGSGQNDLVVHDVVASVITSVVALSCLRFWDEMAKRNVFDQKLNRKFVHISIGLIFLLFWPLFSNGSQAPYLAALAPGVNIFRMIGLGLGIMKNEAMVKSMSRYGNARELLKGPLYYACTITFVTIMFWRMSPIGPVTVCNLCAGDGFADIVGRRLGKKKLPYNIQKSYVGSCTMLFMSSLFSILYLYYFQSFGFYKVDTSMLLSAFVVSLIATITESLPISTQLDDNLTVPLVSVIAGIFLF